VRAIVGGQRAAADGRDAGGDARAPVLVADGLTGGALRGVDLALAPGEIVGVAGLVGSGRTSLLETIFGARPRTAGRLTLDGVPVPPGDPLAAMNRGIAYVPEDRAGRAAFLDLGVTENASAASPGRLRRGPMLALGLERAAARETVERFGVKTPSIAAPLNVLSGGNQQKVILGRWLRQAPRVLLLDEPTQGIDVGARADIYLHIEAAADAGCVVLIASSDFEELQRLCDRVLVLAGGRLVAEGVRAQIDNEWLGARVYGAGENTTGAPT
jgi:ribose transport system ATP-binding protein